MNGRLLAIYVSGEPGEAPASVPEVRAVAERGLEGDRYYRGAGTFSKKVDPGQQVSLIESEAIEALRRDYGVELDPAATRRNLLTGDVYLNHLVGREFHVGPVKLLGIELCEPCGHMQRLAAKPVKKGLVHRGGLRARILEGGMLRVGDPIRA